VLHVKVRYNKFHRSLTKLLKKLSFWDFSHAVHVPQSVCLFLVTVEQNTSFVHQKFTAQMLTGIKVSGLMSWFFLAHSQWSARWINKDPPFLKCHWTLLYWLFALCIPPIFLTNGASFCFFPLHLLQLLLSYTPISANSASSFFSITCFPHLPSF